jgi:hypothetical protein
MKSKRTQRENPGINDILMRAYYRDGFRDGALMMGFIILILNIIYWTTLA